MPPPRLVPLTLALLLLQPAVVATQEVSPDYKVKAAYLYNLLLFVEWPANGAITDPMTICVAGGRNPFGTVLEDTIRGERVGERSVAAKVIRAPDETCHIVFVPDGAAPDAYIRAAASRPTLIVGEEPGFLKKGGMVNFIPDGSDVRFEIDPIAAERAGLRISSRLLQLARIPE